MDTKFHYDSRLHAYIDNELDVDDRGDLLEAMYENSNLRDQVCELRRVKDMVAQAYMSPPPPPNKKAPEHTFNPRKSIAACCIVVALMCLSFAGGWLFHANKETSLTNHLAALGAVQLGTGAQHPGGSHRVLLHVATDSPTQFSKTLHQVNYLLQKGKHKAIQVEVVANSGGLNLLENNHHSPYAARIREMMHKYPNLHFVACGVTLRHLEAAGVPVDLIHHVRVAPSAVQEVVKRLREGWMYINL